MSAGGLNSQQSDENEQVVEWLHELRPEAPAGLGGRVVEAVRARLQEQALELELRRVAWHGLLASAAGLFVAAGLAFASLHPSVEASPQQAGQTRTERVDQFQDHLQKNAAAEARKRALSATKARAERLSALTAPDLSGDTYWLLATSEANGDEASRQVTRRAKEEGQ